MNRQKIMIATLVGVLITAGALASGITAPISVRGETNKSTATVVRDSSTVLLDGKLFQRWITYICMILHPTK